MYVYIKNQDTCFFIDLLMKFLNMIFIILTISVYYVDFIKHVIFNLYKLCYKY